MANVRNGNYTSEMKQTSTESWETGILVSLSALNTFLSITASLGNALILVALHKESSLHPPTKLLLRCLAVTDLCAGFISQPLYTVAVVARITKMNKHDEGYVVTGSMLCGISVLTSTAISVDRLLALMLGLRYRHFLTLKRTRAAIVCLFAIGVSCGAMYLWNKRIAWFVVIIFGVLSLIISIFSYTKIYLTLRQHQAQVQDHVHQGQPNGGGIPLNIARYKKSVSSIAWVQLALVACYVPFTDYCFNTQIKKYVDEGKINSRGLFLYGNSCLLKLVSQPDSLLLEDKNSATSSERDDQTIELLYISLNCVQVEKSR